MTPLPPQAVLSPASVPFPQQQGLGLSPDLAHTHVRSSMHQFQRGLTGHPSTCLESTWPAQQPWVQKVQLGPRSSSACRALGTPEFLGMLTAPRPGGLEAPEFLGSSRDISNSPRGRSGLCQHMEGQPDLAGLPARAEPDSVLDPSGWLCQSQGVSRRQAWQALQPSDPGWAPGRSCWQWRANPWKPLRRVTMFQTH